MLDSAAEAGKFRLHPNCKKPLITHLSFADDLLVLFDGTTSSLRGIMSVFDAFYSTSGLRMNCKKTTLYLDGNNVDLLTVLTHEYGIRRGSLPVRYLGLPLSPYTLKKGDYQVLIDRIKLRLLSWKVRHLSFAGRLLLVQSVLNSVINFWMSVFLLPKQCLNRLEQLCRSFLWKGNDSNARGAKVSWDTVCSPKRERGLGLRRLHIWNKVFGLKLLWMLFSNVGSLWVAWVKAHLIKNGCLWTVQYTQKGSSQWRKLLQLRPLASEFIRCDLKSGENASFWFDRWLPQGTLISLIGDQGPAISGIRSLSSVQEAISGEQWNLSLSSRSPIISALRNLLPPVPRNLNPLQQDIYNWKSSATKTSTRFSAHDTWKLLKTHRPTVAWFKVVWIKPGIPKHCFLFWVAIQGRLNTKDRLRMWGLDVDSQCIFCRRQEETANHLFLSCHFVQEIWGRVLPAGMGSSVNSFQQLIRWILNRQAPGDQIKIERMLIQATIYEIWRERNARLHQQNDSTPGILIKKIKNSVKGKLMAGTNASTTPAVTYPLLQIWFSLFQV